MDALQLKALAARLVAARTEIIDEQLFLGRLLMRLRFGFEDCKTAYTDMRRLVFDPEFVGRLDNRELKFLMLHEVMHCVLKHCTRGRGKLRLLYNVACDIVVNSFVLSAMGFETFTLDGEAVMHLAPDGREGRFYSAEEVYMQLLDETEDRLQQFIDATPDTHDIWEKIRGDQLLEEVWNGHILNEGKVAGFGSGIPQGLSRVVEDVFKAPKIDWRQLLRDLLQNDSYDYTFSPPDRRFANDMALPSFQENAESARVEHVWFLVDTSGSVDVHALSVALAEIRDAIEQVGTLCGEVSFFDSEVTTPTPFESVEEFQKITPVGGGGTSFCEIFRYMKKHYDEELPKAVIILTDGYADFPDESEGENTLVIWLIVNSPVNPPWGETIHIYQEKPTTES